MKTLDEFEEILEYRKNELQTFIDLKMKLNDSFISILNNIKKSLNYNIEFKNDKIFIYLHNDYKKYIYYDNISLNINDDVINIELNVKHDDKNILTSLNDKILQVKDSIENNKMMILELLKINKKISNVDKDILKNKKHISNLEKKISNYDFYLLKNELLNNININDLFEKDNKYIKILNIFETKIEIESNILYKQKIGKQKLMHEIFKNDLIDDNYKKSLERMYKLKNLYI